jgi:phage major head subunit gpT-like protein
MPFLWQMRQAAQLVQRTNVTDDNVFKLRQLEYGFDERGAATYSFPGLAFRMSAS